MRKSSLEEGVNFATTVKKQTSISQEMPIAALSTNGVGGADGVTCNSLARQRRGAISESPPPPAHQSLKDSIGTVPSSNLAQSTTTKSLLSSSGNHGSDITPPQNRWDLLISKIDSNQSNNNNFLKTLKKEIRLGGIPPVHRRKVWLFVTHAQTLISANEHSLTYPNLIANDKSASPWITQIEKDLKRSLPDLLNTPEAYEKLSRVLVAFSLYNPAVGYCQGLNFICAALLSVLSEEETFWVTVLIVDRYMKNYFTQSMIGVKTDVRVFQELLTLREPALAAHLVSLGVGVDTVVLKWSLCLFINCLPFDWALRFLDSYLLEGFKVLLRVSLALFKLNAQKLLSYREFEDAFVTLRELPSAAVTTTMPTPLFQSAFDRSFIGAMARSDIGKWREISLKAVKNEKKEGGPNDAFSPDAELKTSLFRVLG